MTTKLYLSLCSIRSIAWQSKFLILSSLFFFAFLFAANSATLTVTSALDDGSAGTLRERISSASPGDIIDFAAGVTYITLNGNEIVIDKTLTINGGSGTTKVTIDANNLSRIFNVVSCITFNINNLILKKGNSGTSSGGAIYCYGSTLTIANCTFSENTAGYFGGAIDNDANSTCVVVNSTFTENTADNGGAIDNYGSTLTVVNSTFSGNTAYYGGAIYNYNSTLYLYHNTFVDNSAANIGGGIYNYNAVTLYSYNCLYINNKVSGNVSTAGQICGTVYDGTNLIDNTGGTLTIARHTVFGGNTLTPGGYIEPLYDIAKSAVKLTVTNIQVPTSITAAEIIALLSNDQAGNTRPATGNVTYGSVEYSGSGPTIYTITYNLNGGSGSILPTSYF